MLESNNIFDDMRTFAMKKHRGQEYGDSGRPYMNHIREVVQETEEILRIQHPSITIGTEEYWMILAGAMGHDLVEDCGVTADDLRERGHNETVITTIFSVSKQTGESLTAYIDRILVTSFHGSIVKQADSLCNLRHSIRSGNKRLIDKYTLSLRLLNHL